MHFVQKRIINGFSVNAIRQEKQTPIKNRDMKTFLWLITCVIRYLYNTTNTTNVHLTRYNIKWTLINEFYVKFPNAGISDKSVYINKICY